MSGKQRRNLIRILVASAMMAALHFAPVQGLLRFALYLVPYLVVGYDILIKAVKGLVRRRPFDECLLMAVATVGAMALAVYEDGDYAEGIAVMLFYQVGEWFQSYAVGKSRRSVSALMDIRPDHANVECDGRLKRVDPEDVPVGTVITVLAGERVPIDGMVIEGSSSLNASALTGESLPRDVAPGDGIVSGCVNGGGVLRVRTTKEFGRSTVSRILELVEDAGSRKSRSEAFISRFARVYTPAVVLGAALLALLPPLVRVAAMGLEPAWGSWVYRALTFLVVSCPCALVISIPLSFFAGIGGAGREGVLVKGSNYLEALSRTRTVVFDKTGTLTKGVFEVTAIHPESLDERGLLHLAAHVERYSTHPVGNSLRRAYPDEADDCRVEDVQEVAGQGVRARVNGRTVCVGNPAMMESVGAAWHPCNRCGTIIHVAIDGEYAGHVVIADVVKPNAREAVAELRRAGVRRTVMLTGDDQGMADLVARELHEAGIGAFAVDGSGDLLVSSPEPVRIGLEDPRSQGRVIGVVALAEAAICASAVSRRSWGHGLHHLLDARTGLPVQGVLATWAVARTCAEADGLATALFVTAPEVLARAGFHYDFALMRADGSAVVSRDFADIPGELFTA